MNDHPVSIARVVDHPLVQHKLSLMRRADTPAPLFRRLLHETAMLLAFETLRDFPTLPVRIDTPLSPCEGRTLAMDPIVVSILRAGNGILEGILELVPTARVGFLGMFRKPDTLEAVQYYAKLPTNMSESPILVVDPMLATANTAIAATQVIKDSGARDIRFLCLVASPEGLDQLHSHHPDIAVYTAAVDDHLNESGYIVPGLGDAGDRIYGTT